jgi:hypothetical protein
MSSRQTAKIASPNLLDGDKLYLERARKALPLLVRQAKAGQSIYYSSLAKEIEIANPRNLNFILGSIGNAMIQLGKENKIEIPPIQCLVINKREGVPGEGVGWFLDRVEFGKLSKTQKQKILSIQLIRIFTFSRWDWVLEQLNLKPIKSDLSKLISKARAFKEGGESLSHRMFKEYIAKNPIAIGLTEVEKIQIEYALPSSDKIDILIYQKSVKIGIEVKSKISDSADILRGLFQCVKYKYLIEAEQIINDEMPNCRTLLVLQGKLPNELNLVRNLLGIEVIENVMPDVD